MLRIITLNLNGIRSAWKKGVLPWAAAQNADVVCLQELKAQSGDLDAEMLTPDGMNAYYHCAEKKGYSGVGLWCRKKPDALFEGIGHPEFDAEGRYLRADFGRRSSIRSAKAWAARKTVTRTATIDSRNSGGGLVTSSR